MYWTDSGVTGKIERASMDGSDRRELHSISLTSPISLTIDYQAQRIYWINSWNQIEYSNTDGTGRFLLSNQLAGFDSPIDITLEGDSVFWTSHSSRSIYTTHKILSTGVSSIHTNLRNSVIYGIEAVTPIRQNQNG